MGLLGPVLFRAVAFTLACDHTLLKLKWRVEKGDTKEASHQAKRAIVHRDPESPGDPQHGTVQICLNSALRQ